MKLHIIYDKTAPLPLVQEIVNRFAAVRVTLWTAEETAHAGSPEAIVDASDAVVAVITPAFLQNEMALGELEYALQTKEELVVPVLAETAELPFGLVYYVDMCEFADRKTFIDSAAFSQRVREIFEMIYDPFLERGQEQYDEAEAAYEEESNFTTRCNFARICLEMGDFTGTLGGTFAFNRAKVFYLKALELAEESDLEYPCYNSRHDMALACLSLGDLAQRQKSSVAKWREQALSWYLSAYNYVEQNHRENPGEATRSMLYHTCMESALLCKDVDPTQFEVWSKRLQAITY